MKTKLITLLIVGLTALTGTATIYASGGVEPLKTRVKTWVEAKVAPADLRDDGEELPSALTTEEPLTEDVHLRGRFCQTLASTEEPDSDSSAEPTDIHPQVEKIVEDLELDDPTKDAEIEKISRWFCEGRFGFGEIKQAYKWSVEGMTAEEILELRAQGYSWGHIKQQIKQMCEGPEEGCDSTFLPPGLKKNGKTPGKWKVNGDDAGSSLGEDQPGNTPLENPGKGPKDKPEKQAKGPKK